MSVFRRSLLTEQPLQSDRSVYHPDEATHAIAASCARHVYPRAAVEVPCECGPG